MNDKGGFTPFILKIKDKEFYIIIESILEDRIEYTASSEAGLTDEDKCDIEFFFTDVLQKAAV